MISDRDIFMSAMTMIIQYGDKASIHVAMRADELLDQGDLDGAAVCKRIVKSVEELLDTEAPNRSQLN